MGDSLIGALQFLHLINRAIKMHCFLASAWLEAQQPPARPEAVQESAPGYGPQGQVLRGRLPQQGHPAGESGHRGKAVQLGHQDVRPGAADQEQQEGHDLCVQQRLTQLHPGK